MAAQLPRITVVTVCFNCRDEIAATIGSVASQDYPDLEYLVIDGASSDGTLEVIGRYGDAVDRLVSEPDKGVYDAMNKAIEMASGSWICFMNAGDRFASPDVLSRMMEHAGPGVMAIYGDTLFIHADGHTSMHNTASEACLAKVFSQYQPYTHQAVMYNIADKGDCLYDLRYRICADYDTAIRYFKRYGTTAFRHVPLTVAEYKAFDGISSRDDRAVLRESIIIRLRHRMDPYCIFKSVLHYVFRF